MLSDLVARTHDAFNSLMKAVSSRSFVMGRSGVGQHDAVAAGGQPSQRGIDQVRDHIAHSPCAGERRPLPVFGRECAQQPDDVGRQRAEQGTSVGGRQRHGWEYSARQTRETYPADDGRRSTSSYAAS